MSLNSSKFRFSADGWSLFRLAFFGSGLEAQRLFAHAAANDFVQTDKRPAADEQDVGRVHRDEFLVGMFAAPWGGTLPMVPSRIFSSACCTPSPETSRVMDGFSSFRPILSTSSM